MKPCANCGEPRPEKAYLHGWRRDYCGPCAKRWHRHGYPPEGPPPPWASRAARVEDYTDLRSWDVPDSQAAERIGVSTRTLERYTRERTEAS